MEELQSYWEIPSIAYFCHVFQETLNLFEFQIEELEAAFLPEASQDDLLKPPATLEELIRRLLEGCCKKKINDENWVDCLHKLFQTTGKDEELALEVFNTPFSSWNLRTKVSALMILCEIRLDHCDSIDQFVESDVMRINPIGVDSEDNIYWYFFGLRLYKEEPAKQKNSKSKKGNTETNSRKRKAETKRYNGACGNGEYKRKSNGQQKDEADHSSRWKIICQTREDWESFMLALRKSRSPKDKNLAKEIEMSYFPAVLEEITRREAVVKKRMIELMPKRTSARIDKVKQQKEQERALAEQERLRKIEEEQRQRAKEEEGRKKRDAEMRAKRAAEREKAIEDRAKRARLREMRIFENRYSDSLYTTKEMQQFKNGFKDDIDTPDDSSSSQSYFSGDEYNKGKVSDRNSSEDEHDDDDDDSEGDHEWKNSNKGNFGASSKKYSSCLENVRISNPVLKQHPFSKPAPKNKRGTLVKPVTLTSVLLKSGLNASSSKSTRTSASQPRTLMNITVKSVPVSNLPSNSEAVTNIVRDVQLGTSTSSDSVSNIALRPIIGYNTLLQTKTKSDASRNSVPNATTPSLTVMSPKNISVISNTTVTQERPAPIAGTVLFQAQTKAAVKPTSLMNATTASEANTNSLPGHTSIINAATVSHDATNAVMRPISISRVANVQVKTNPDTQLTSSMNTTVVPQALTYTAYVNKSAVPQGVANTATRTVSKTEASQFVQSEGKSAVMPTCLVNAISTSPANQNASPINRSVVRAPTIPQGVANTASRSVVLSRSQAVLNTRYLATTTAAATSQAITNIARRPPAVISTQTGAQAVSNASIRASKPPAFMNIVMSPTYVRNAPMKQPPVISNSVTSAPQNCVLINTALRSVQTTVPATKASPAGNAKPQTVLINALKPIQLTSPTTNNVVITGFNLTNSVQGTPVRISAVSRNNNIQVNNFTSPHSIITLPNNAAFQQNCIVNVQENSEDVGNERKVVQVGNLTCSP